MYKWWERIYGRPAVKIGLTIPSGEEFRYGYQAVQKMKKEDPEGTEKMEAPLREALENARQEFGYVYRSP